MKGMSKESQMIDKLFEIDKKMKNKVKNTEDLEDKKYYKPIYCYRHWPSTDDIYKHIIQDMVRDGKITLYEDIEKAKEMGRAELCDDDCYGIAVFDFTSGACDIYYNTKEFPPRSITFLTRWSKCYKVIQTEVES